MGRVEVVRCGTGRVRVGPWRGHPHIALLAPLPGQSPSTNDVIDVVEGLWRQGYHEVLTSALAAGEQGLYLSAGFEVHERLHLLRHPLRTLPEAPAVRLRRARRSDRSRVLDVDTAAFSSFWRLDEVGLRDALVATPSVRFRVASGRRRTAGSAPVSGYAVWGRAGTIGYLQRLAVDPRSQSRGVGSALVADGLRWCARRGCSEALVNTQEHNLAALGLYEKVGFQRQEHGLAVLRRTVTPVL